LKSDTDQFRPLPWKFENVHVLIGAEPIHFETKYVNFLNFTNKTSVFFQLQEACRIAETEVYDHGSMMKACGEGMMDEEICPLD
jgi:hypothetical protein